MSHLRLTHRGFSSFVALSLALVFTLGNLALANDDVTADYATKYINQYEYTKAQFSEKGDREGMLPPLDGIDASPPAPNFSMKSYTVTKTAKKAVTKSAKKSKLASKKKTAKSKRTIASLKSSKAQAKKHIAKKKAGKPKRETASKLTAKPAHKRIYVGNLTPE